MTRLHARLMRGDAPLALVVWRSPEIERVAWRQSRRVARSLERCVASAFLSAVGRLARTDDVPAHDAGSDCFVLALLSASRVARPLFDARAAHERIAAAVLTASGQRLEGGWTPLEQPEDACDARAAIVRALDRGARERERFAFLAAVGHELRTPLTCIRGYIETALDEGDREEARGFLGSALRETQRMTRLVDGMLEFSLLDLSARGASESECDVRSCIANAVSALRQLAIERGIIVTLDAVDEVRARVGADRCEHVLINLVQNAIKYGRSPGGCVRAACRRDGAHALIVVEDDGPGIAASERDAIFTMGVRGAAATGPGNGIGLAIVRTIVEREGGRLGVDDSELGGARFWIRLPSVRARGDRKAGYVQGAVKAGSIAPLTICANVERGQSNDGQPGT